MKNSYTAFFFGSSVNLVASRGTDFCQQVSLTTSRQATSLAVGDKKIPSSPVKDDGVSAFLALID